MTTTIILLFVLTTLSPLVQVGAVSGIVMDFDLMDADAIFYPVGTDDELGYSVSIVGDVNGDGYDDLMVGAPGNDDAYGGAGVAYLYFGKASGWSNDTNGTTADASFVGEEQWWGIGRYISPAGDANGDGYDDFLLMSTNAEDNYGKVYLFLGKASGWSTGTNVSAADASFIGEAQGAGVGRKATGAGDVNGDGYADILIAASSDTYGGTEAGQTYMFLGKPSGWAADTSVTQADASFIGGLRDRSGGGIGGAGDVNGDGFADILIGAPVGTAGYTEKAYLIFGRDSGWSFHMDLPSTANASITREQAWSSFGSDVMGVGDVNADGYDDFIIAAGGWDNGPANSVGKTYLFFGSDTGWGMGMTTSAADATFIGEMQNDFSGGSNGGYGSAGDVNGDGFADFIIPSNNNGEGGMYAGQTYLILGKASGWTTGVSLGSVDASFIGVAGTSSGGSASLCGDVNGDGFDDLLIGGGEDNTGMAHLVFVLNNPGPSNVASVRTYADPDFLRETSYAMVNDTVYVELTGTDTNASQPDIAVVNVQSDSSPAIPFRLRETGDNTGVFRGNFTIKDRTVKDRGWVNATVGDIITVSYNKDPTKFATVLVGGIGLPATMDDTMVYEDDTYTMFLTALNATQPDWMWDTNASWLDLNATSMELSGTPNNTMIGDFFVYLKATDAYGRFAEVNYTVTVVNTPPEILEDLVLMYIEEEEELMMMDYGSSDDGQGDISWHLETDAGPWLMLDEDTGVLNGTPANEDVGQYYVNVSVDDGNGGWDSNNFTLVVNNTNDPPAIMSVWDPDAWEDDDDWEIWCEVADVDAGDSHTWTMDTDADWITLNVEANGTAHLNGTPDNDDVGTYYVNLTVKDSGNATASLNESLEVLNTNDLPVWVDVPDDMVLSILDVFVYDINATDVDAGDSLTYALTTDPATALAAINATSGEINWTPNGYGNFTFNVSATDDTVTIHHEWVIEVVFENVPPYTELDTPADGATVNTLTPTLTWTVVEPNADDWTVTLYISTDKAEVDGLAASGIHAEDLDVVSYTFTTPLVKGTTYYWTVIPFDGTDVGTCHNGTFSFKVSVDIVTNNPPTIEIIPSQVVRVGKTFEYTVQANDPDGDALTYTLSGQPAGMTITNGVISWKPKKGDVGTYSITVSVSDSEASPVPTTFSLEVKETKEGGAEVGDMTIPIIIIIIVVILLLLALAMRGGKRDEGVPDEDEEIEEDEEEEGGEEE